MRASRRPRAASCAWSSPPAGRCAWTGVELLGLPPRQLRAPGATSRWCSRTRTRRSTRRCSSGELGGRAARRAPRPRSRREKAERVAELLAPRRAAARVHDAVPARVLRRAAPAPDDRPGHRRRPAAPGARRGRQRPGRVHPEPGDRPARGAVGRPVGLTYLFIAHDLVGRPPHLRPGRGDVPRPDRRARATPPRVFDAPAHPYTEALLSAVPVPSPGAQRDRERIVLAGDPPDPSRVAAGLPLPHPLPVRHGRLPHRGAGADAGAGLRLGVVPPAHVGPRAGGRVGPELAARRDGGPRRATGVPA